MAIMRRVGNEGNFAIVPHDILNEPQMSWAAKGLLSHLLQHAAGWEVYTETLVKNFQGGRDLVRKLIAELMLHGYVVRYQTKNTKGRFGEYIFDIYRVAVPYSERTLPKGYEQSIKNHIFSELITKIKTSKQDNEINMLTPKPEKPSSVETPNPEKPISEKPKPVDPTLTIINNNKNKEKQDDAISSAIYFIGDSLTEEQRKHVETLFDEKAISLTGLSRTQYLSAIEHELLDPNSFKNAQQSFYDKLNIVLSMVAKDNQIIKSRLAKLAKSEKENIGQQHDKSLNDLNYKIRTQASEVRHYERMVSQSGTDSQRKLMQQQLEASKQKLSELKQQLQKAQYTHANELSEDRPHSVAQ